MLELRPKKPRIQKNKGNRQHGAAKPVMWAAEGADPRQYCGTKQGVRSKP